MNGNEKLHVTQILQLAGLQQFPVPKWYLERGRLVHKACEMYDKNILDESSIAEEILPFFSAWKKFRGRFRGEIVYCEQKIEHTRLEYVGTIDRLIQGANGIKTDYLLLDIKTNSHYFTSQLQLEAYRQAILSQEKRKKKKMTIATVVLQANAEPSVYIHPVSNFLSKAWLGCIAIARWRMSQK